MKREKGRGGNLVLLVDGVDAVVVQEGVRQRVLIRRHAPVRIHNPRRHRLRARLVAVGPGFSVEGLLMLEVNVRA